MEPRLFELLKATSVFGKIVSLCSESNKTRFHTTRIGYTMILETPNASVVYLTYTTTHV